MYRVEGPDGSGPYVGDYFSMRFEIGRAHMNLRHPSPNADASLNNWIEYNEYCGFDSPENLLRWFEQKWQDALEAEDFVITVYEIDQARTGKYGQTCFVRAIATVITRYKFSELVAECKQLGLKNLACRG